MNKFLKFGVFLLIIFFGVQTFFVENYIPSLLAASVFPLLFLYFLIKIDVFETESFKDIIYVFLFGLVISFFLCIPYVIFREVLFDNYATNLFVCFIAVALPEEIIKIIPFLLVLKYRKFVNEPIDFLIYSSASALGFAFYENINYIIGYSETGNIVAIRSFLPSVMHMVVSSIFSFGIFLYLKSKKIKFIFVGLILASLIHAIYNTLFIIAPIILLIILVYYSKLIQSLLNISPYYDKSKEIKINQAKNFLFFLILAVLVLSFSFDLFFNGFNSVLNDPKSYIYLLIVPYFIYNILSSKLVLNKGEFIVFGNKNNLRGIKSEIQNIIMGYYARKS
ncbi:MAG: PrsW family intramembrane metalloprotease [Flavobacteriaceae bacterium]